MARCACGNQTCSCIVQAVPASGITVVGNGSATRPYLIGQDSAGNPLANLRVADTATVDLTLTPQGGGSAVYTLQADALLSMSELTDVPDTVPANGQVLVWRTDHWAYENQTGGSGGGGLVGERVYATLRRNASALNLPTSGTAVRIPFDTAISDDNSIPWVAGEFTVPVAGWYDIEAATNYMPSATGYRQLRLIINGATMSAQTVNATSASIGTAVNFAQSVLLAAGDKVSMNGNQTSGGALTLDPNQSSTWISIVKTPQPVVTGSAASGVWGVGPLAGFGSDSLIGREIYVDSKSQLRAKPDADTGLISDGTGMFTPNATNFTLVSFGARVRNGVAQMLIRGTMKVVSSAPSTTGDITDIPLGTISGILASSSGSPTALTSAHAGRGVFATINSGALTITNINGTAALTVGETITLSGIWLI